MSAVILFTRQWTSWPEFAGATWVPMQWVLGLSRLGADVLWLDVLDPVDPRRDSHSIEYLMYRIALTAREFGFDGRWAVMCGDDVFGARREDLRAAAGAADLLVSLGGKRLPAEPALRSIPRRAYVDLDPGFTQVWAGLPQKCDMGFDDYNLFFTIGQNVGGPGFRVPVGDVRWQKMWPPVVLDLWATPLDGASGRFSTVGDWWGSQHIRLDSKIYSGKREEFLRFLGVPAAAGQEIDLALSIYPRDHEDLGRLHANGWRVLNPCKHAGDPHSYREFIRYSAAEFSVAKSGYVATNSGWISDRSACYLAAGKPVLVQQTGLDPYLPTGRGLLTFSTVEEAVSGIRSIRDDYPAHSRAAMEIARSRFDSDVVLADLLSRCGL